MRGKKAAGILVSIICVIIIAAVIAVLAMGAGCTVLSGDDFTHGVRVGAFHVSLPKYFWASLLYVQDLYMDWQGTWFSMFLQAFLSPINNFGLPQLRAVMVGNALLFLGSLAALLWVGFILLFGRKWECAAAGWRHPAGKRRRWKCQTGRDALCLLSFCFSRSSF